VDTAPHLLHDLLAVGGAQAGQEGAVEQRAAVELRHDGHVAVGGAGEANVVRGAADVLPPDNDVGGLRPAIAVVAVEREGLALLDDGKADVGQRRQQQLAIFEGDIRKRQVLRHMRLLRRDEQSPAHSGTGLSSAPETGLKDAGLRTP
jgi:hypothetical protein